MNQYQNDIPPNQETPTAPPPDRDLPPTVPGSDEGKTPPPDAAEAPAEAPKPDAAGTPAEAPKPDPRWPFPPVGQKEERPQDNPPSNGPADPAGAVLQMFLWRDPPPKRRALKMAIAMLLALLASALLSGGVTPDTMHATLINLMLALSLPGMEAAAAGAQLMLLFVGLTVLLAAFATFASYSRSLPIALFGAVGIGVSVTTQSGLLAGGATALLLILPTLLVSPLHRKMRYKELLSLTTLLFVALLMVSLAGSVLLAEGNLSIDALRQSITTVSADYAAFYALIAEAVVASGVEKISVLPMLPQEGALSLVLNYLPGLIGCMAMLMAFWFVTWFYRADGRQPPRIAIVTMNFSLSRTGAFVYLLCTGLTFWGNEVLSLAAVQLMMLLSLPFSIQGVDAMRRSMMIFGRTIPLLIFFFLLLFAPPVGMILFFAACGVFDALIPTPPWREPRQ
ncbi:MAG: hypothetical protein IJC43_03940 [Clostridia bacterium]|nr:hypothetical protein [Clostridia bacterium]